MLVQYEHAPRCFSFINLDGEDSAGFSADGCPGILWMATKENYFIFLKLALQIAHLSRSYGTFQLASSSYMPGSVRTQNCTVSFRVQ